MPQKRFSYRRVNTATTVKDICKKAGIKLGTFTYHYKSKDSLAVSIYHDFVGELTERVYALVDAARPPVDPFTREIATYRSYFTILDSSEAFRRFYCEICTTEEFRKVNYQMNEGFIQSTLQNFARQKSGLFYPPNEIDFPVTVTLVSGMEIRFVQALFSGKYEDRNRDDLIDYFLMIYYSIFCKDRREIQKRAPLARAFAPQMLELCPPVG